MNSKLKQIDRWSMRFSSVGRVPFNTPLMNAVRRDRAFVFNNKVTGREDITFVFQTDRPTPDETT